MATLATLRTDTYAILNEPQTSNIYSIDFVDQMINTKQTELATRAKWSFLRYKYLTYGAMQTTLSSDITTISTTLTVGDTTGFASSGAVRLSHDIITYTGKTSTTLTGCSGISINHEEGTIVNPLIAVPSNYFRMPELRVQRATGGRFIPFTYVDELEYDMSPITDRFTMVFDNDGNKYFMVNYVSSTDVLAFHYLKEPTTLDDDADVSSIPDLWARKIIPIMAASEALILRGDDINGLGSTLMQKAEQEILNMLKHFGDREQGLRGMFDKQYRSGIPSYRQSVTIRT